jgi:hypothetical protein
METTFLNEFRKSVTGKWLRVEYRYDVFIDEWYWTISDVGEFKQIDTINLKGRICNIYFTDGCSTTEPMMDIIELFESNPLTT